jgi:3-hydroxyisobutyrate dehydrogenase-like beta-hydroxyacid dehydrogenase
MAEAARRYQQAGGSDLVRRLMARPVRLEQQVRTRMPLRDPRRVDAFADAYADEAADDAEALAEADAIVRLETELQVMKAVLRAQRQEVESLRAQRQLLTDSAPTDDVRATRERWAALVDSLLIRAR